MDFSFVIPTFNSAQYIGSCLKAIFALHYDRSQYEVLIVDGGSVDNTLQCVAAYPEVVILHSENKSIADSRNRGVQKARGRYLAFIDSDCLVDRDLLQKAAKHLQEYECCGSFYRSSAEQGWVARVWLAAEGKKSGPVNWITSGTLLVRKDFFLEVGGFNEALQTEEDEDFGRRVREHGGQLMNDLSMASIHLGQPDSLGGFFRKEMWRGMSLIKPHAGSQRGGFSLFDSAIIFYALNCCLVFVSFFYSGSFIFQAATGVFFSFPLLLVIRKMGQTGEWKYIPGMYVLYLVFLLARSFSLFRYNQFRHLFSSFFIRGIGG